MSVWTSTHFSHTHAARSTHFIVDAIGLSVGRRIRTNTCSFIANKKRKKNFFVESRTNKIFFLIATNECSKSTLIGLFALFLLRRFFLVHFFCSLSFHCNVHTVRILFGFSFSNGFYPFARALVNTLIGFSRVRSGCCRCLFCTILVMRMCLCCTYN